MRAIWRVSRNAQTSFNGSITELTFYLAHLSYSLEHLIMMLGEKDGPGEWDCENWPSSVGSSGKATFGRSCSRWSTTCPFSGVSPFPASTSCPAKRWVFHFWINLPNCISPLTTIESAFIWLFSKSTWASCHCHTFWKPSTATTRKI